MARSFAERPQLLGALDIDISPDDRVSDLTIAQRQMVEIARAVSYEAHVLIMDEPTSTLSEREVTQLFRIVADLKARGSAVIYITHKIDEVFRIADAVTVMRDGRIVGSSPSSRLDRDWLITMMVGRELTQLFPKDNVPTDRVLLSVKALSLDGTFADVSFDVRAGEILGIAGLVGSKRTELAETIFGVRHATSGDILIDGVAAEIDSPASRSIAGWRSSQRIERSAGSSCRSACTRTWRWRLSAASSSAAGFVKQAKLLAACRAPPPPYE